MSEYHPPYTYTCVVLKHRYFLHLTGRPFGFLGNNYHSNICTLISTHNIRLRLHTYICRTHRLAPLVRRCKQECSWCKTIEPSQRGGSATICHTHCIVLCHQTPFLRMYMTTSLQRPVFCPLIVYSTTHEAPLLQDQLSTETSLLPSYSVFHHT